jgi:hypothetical protein
MNRATTRGLSQVAWRKSTRSSGGGSNCVEVACLSGRVGIRDSKNPDGGTLTVTAAVFRELTDGIRRGTLGGWYSSRRCHRAHAYHQGWRRMAHSGMHDRVMAAMRRMVPGSQRS